MIEVCIYESEKGSIGAFIGKYEMPVVPRIGEFIFGEKAYEVVDVRYMLDGPRNKGFNWVDILVNIHAYKKQH